MSNVVKILNKDGQPVVTSRQIAEDFEKEHSSVVVRAIENLIKDLKGSGQNCTHLFIETKYKNEQNKQYYKEYLLTRDGFSLLVMGFTGTKALQWKLKYIEAFNKMEEHIKAEQRPTCIEDILITQLQEMKSLKAEVQANKLGLEDVKKETKGIRDIVAINSKDWKSDCKSIVVQIAQKENINYQDVYREAYSALEKRAACQLSIRKTNIQKKMALEGICKSKIDKVTKLDAIESDKRLVECFLGIVKEMAIKYGISISKES